MNEWIKIENGLPPVNDTGEYLIWDREHKMEIAHWNGEEWLAPPCGPLGLCYSYKSVTHWMRLPGEPNE